MWILKFNFHVAKEMPGTYITYNKEQQQKNNDALFEKLKKQCEANLKTREEERLPQKSNPISFYTPTLQKYDLRSKSNCNTDEKDTSPDATPSPKQTRMPDFTRHTTLDGSLNEDCELHKEYSGSGELFVDISPCSNPRCSFYDDGSKKKSKPKRKAQKRLKLVDPVEQQEKENQGPAPSNETPTTSSIPVKRFYNKRRTPSPIASGNISPMPSLITPDEINEAVTPTPKDRLEPIWTRSRPYFTTNPTHTYPPYEIGLRNIDNTCYVNATLQALFSLTGFTDDLVTACQGVENLPQFSSLLVNMIDARKKGLPIEVDKFNEDLVKNLWMLHPSYSVNEQQDASEFLIRLIEHLKLTLPAGPTNPVESHFECEMIEVVHCTSCGKKKKRAQKQTSICLPMPKDSRNLEQCLDDYMAEEERELACSSCKAATSKISSKFRTLPSKLIMSVNRFSKEAKLAKHIVPPRVLDIRPFLENLESQLPSVYTLAAQIVHMGYSKDSGHYVSHVKCEDGVWRCYNDMSILSVSIDEEIHSVDGEPAYVYFYVHEMRTED